MSDPKLHQTDQYKGWLNKWTNYLKGYQRRWFVLQNDGLLSYYRWEKQFSNERLRFKSVTFFLFFFFSCLCSRKVFKKSDLTLKMMIYLLLLLLFYTGNEIVNYLLMFCVCNFLYVKEKISVLFFQLEVLKKLLL